MPKYNVMVNRTRTIEESVEIEVSAKDEGAAQDKIDARVNKALESGKLDTAFDWEHSDTNDEFEYDVSEA